MPFTFSHPAIVLPLRLAPGYFSLTGLVIGSMSPDFEYFIRMRPEAVHGHLPEGVFYFDLPLSLLLAFLFHNIVRDSLIENLPQVFRSRFIECRNFDWNNYFRSKWLIVICSIIIGAFSHLFWDGFTHATGFFVKEYPQMRNKISVAGLPLPYYNVLQHLSTLVGGLIILVTVLRMPSVKTAEKKIVKYWAYVALISAMVVALRMVGGISIRQYGDLFVSGITGFFIALMLIPFILTRETVS